MTETPEQKPEAEGDPSRPARPPQKQRPKMSLGEQYTFLGRLLDRCKMHTGDQMGYLAKEAMLTLDHDDMLNLETVQQTLAVFELYKADELVKREAYRRRGK